MFSLTQRSLRSPTSFILDGFPRTVEQASALDRCLEETGDVVTHAIALEAPDDVLSKRMSGRWVHARSGRAYHEVDCPPKSLLNCFDANSDRLPPPTAANMRDDATGEPLTQRGQRGVHHRAAELLLADPAGAGTLQKKSQPSVASDDTVGSVLDIEAALNEDGPLPSGGGGCGGRLCRSRSPRPPSMGGKSFSSEAARGARTSCGERGPKARRCETTCARRSPRCRAWAACRS